MVAKSAAGGTIQGWYWMTLEIASHCGMLMRNGKLRTYQSVIFEPTKRVMHVHLRMARDGGECKPRIVLKVEQNAHTAVDESARPGRAQWNSTHQSRPWPAESESATKSRGILENK